MSSLLLTIGRGVLNIEWQDFANCRDEDPDLFFPYRGGTGDGSYHAFKAKKICGGCAVRSECLDYALLTNQQFGIWGGLKEGERRRVRRRLLSQR